MRKLFDRELGSILTGVVVALLFLTFSSISSAVDMRAFAKPDPLFRTIPIQLESEADQRFKQMKTMPSLITDPKALDDFIRRYPESEHAPIVFFFRYELAAKDATLESYNDFITKYPEKLQSRIAIQEVYKLFRAQDRVSGYFDFLKLYPDSEQALVAKERIQQLMFEYVCTLEDEDEFDSYISTFPDSPQVDAALQLATMAALNKEQEEFNIFKKQNPSRDELMDKATGIINEYRLQVDQFVRKNPSFNETEKMDVEKAFEITHEIKKFERRSVVLTKIYGKYDRAGIISSKTEYLEIVKRLNTLQTTIQDNHKELLKKMDEDTDRICKWLEQIHKNQERIISELQSGFKMLHEDLVNIGQKLDVVNNNLKEVIEHIDQTTNSIQQLHQATLDFHQTVRQGLDNLDIQMAQVNQRLIDVRDSIAEGFRETNQSMKDGFTTLNTTVQTGFDNQLAMLETMNQSIVEGFENTNQSLAVIGQKIDYTNDNIAQLNNSMIEGFGSVNANLGRIDNNLTAGFNTINSSLDVIGNKLNQMDQHVIEGFRQTNLNIDKTNQKLDILDKNVRKGFEAQRQLTKQVLYETRQSNRQLSELKSISVAGFQNIGNQLRSTNAMLQSMQVQNRAKASSSKRGIFGKILGTVVGAAASCIPAVGPIVGPIAGGLVSNLVGGDSSASFDGPVVKPADLPKAIFNDVKTEVVDRVKDKLAKSVPTVFQEDKWRILDTAVKLSKNGKKIPKGYEDLIFKSKNSDDLLKNVVHLADYCEISPKSLVYAAKHIF